MEITKNTIESILKTLPIGYYVKRRVTVELSETEETSYYLPTEDKIVFALKNILSVFENEKCKPYASEEVMVRGILYHETSHAILTPNDLINPYMYEDEQTALNIFEDERIETILRNYYMDTDFFKQKENLLGGLCTNVKNPINMFWNLVRFRYCPACPKLVDEVARIITDYRYVNKNNSVTNYYWFDGNPLANDYYREIIELYRKVKKLFNAKGGGSPISPNEANNISNNARVSQGMNGKTKTDSSKVPQWVKDLQKSDNAKNRKGKSEEDTTSACSSKGNSGNESGGESEAESGYGSGSGELGKGENNASSTNNPFADTEADKTDNIQSDKSGMGGYVPLEDVISAITNVYANDDIIQPLNLIIDNYKKKSGGGCAIQTYSGVFNPRCVARNDYRYFERSINNNGNNTFGSCHLNLFIDRSGSFKPNEKVVNQLLFALRKIEQTTQIFSFDVCYCECGQEIVTDKNRLAIEANGGNFLDKEIYKQFKSLQKPNTYNYNIVLFDGWASPEKSPFHADHTTFEAFNSVNCTLISESSNKEVIENDCPSAKRIYTNRYADELIKNVIETLRRAFA